MEFRTLVWFFLIVTTVTLCDRVIIEEELEPFLSSLESFSLTPNAVVFVVDESGSIGQKTYQDVKHFIHLVARRFSISSSHSRVAVISFSEVPRTHLNYIKNIQGSNMCTLLKVIDNMDYIGLGTYTSLAMNEARNILLQARPGANKIIILITDGQSNGGYSPINISEKLKQEGVIIFAVGVADVNMEEVNAIATSKDHIYTLKNFDYIKELNKYLKKETNEVNWDLISDTSMCDNFCENKTKCCDDHSKCYCGSLSGDYQCVCDAGYQGTGTKDTCLKCPKGTYRSLIEKAECTKCPEHSTTPTEGSISFGDCKCQVGYIMAGNLCKPIECAKLNSPEGGVLIPNNCENIYGSRCQLKCKEGFCPFSCHEAHSHDSQSRSMPLRQCLETGKWTGEEFFCEKMRCPVLDQPLHGSYDCVGLDFEFGTTCQFKCEEGYVLNGSSSRTCLINGTWTGTQTVCNEIQCEALKRNQYLKVKPKKCSSEKMPFRSICRYYCAEGYSLVSENGKTDGINECLFNKTWSNIGEKISCADITPPTIRCPNSIKTLTDPGKATARVSWREATADDNVFVSAIFIKSPPFVTKSSQAFPIGVTKIVYEAIDSSNNSNSCSFTITVLDKEPPKVLECPENIEIFYGKKSAIPVSWNEPVFWDNSKQLSPPIKNHKSGDKFSWGNPSPVYYNVTDPSGNTATCAFTVKIKRHPCVPLVSPVNGFVTCDSWEDGRLCSVHCAEGYNFATKQEIPNVFECKVSRDGSTYKWVPFLNSKLNFNFPIPDCSRIQKRNAVNETIQLSYKVDICNEEMINKMKEKFVDTLKKSFGPVGGIICPVNGGCRPGNVKISCGNDLQKRFKRNVDKHHKVLVVNIDVAMYPGEDEDLHNLVTEASDLNQANMDLSQALAKDIESIATRNMKEIYNIDSIETPEISVKIDMICSLGQIKRNNSCVDCPAGTYKNDFMEDCLDCPFASYQDKINAFSCLPCPLGFTTYETKSKHFSDCKAPCQPGTHSRTTFEPCQPCPLHTYQEHPSRKECFRCPIGLLTWKAGSNSSKDCVSSCKPGSYSDTGLEPCSLCDFGSYQSQLKQNLCEICPDGTTTKRKGSTAESECQKTDICELSPCSNFATCVQIGNNYTCICSPGSYGKNCEQMINFCESDSCSNGGTCLNKLDGYTCVCPEGFSGQNCEINVDDCEKNSCYNNGRCIDLVNDFACDCNAGYSGPRCEINIFDCLSDPCHNGGTCIDKVNGYKCCCLPGYVGEQCERELDKCDSVICENGGTCYSEENEFICKCKPEFEGKYCEEEKKIDYCANYTCLNGGSCEMEFNLPICKCTGHYIGLHCEKEMTAIYSLNFASPTTANYAKVENGELLYAITVSFFMRTHLKDSGRRPTPLSYSYYDQEKKELVDNALTFFDINRIVLYLHGEMIHTGYVANNDTNWHHYAVTWERNEGKWSFLVDGKYIRNGTHVGKENYFWPGFFVLGQEQDSLGGTFSISEAFAGDITEFNVWNYAMSQDEIVSTFSSCGRVGNVVPWPRVSHFIHGSVTVSKDNSLCQEIGSCSEKDCHCFYSTKEMDVICEHSVQECDPNACGNFQPCIVNSSRSFCNCSTGFKGKFCEYDLNECLEDNGGCSHVCVNTIGSYECNCPNGMFLSKDGLNCQDSSFCKVDEQIYLDNETWISECQECICKRGNVLCSEIQCPDTYCPTEQVWTHLPGECCPKCASYAFCTVSSNNTLLKFDYSSIEISSSCDFTIVEDCVEGQFSLRLESASERVNSNQSLKQGYNLESNQITRRNLVIFQDCQNLRISEAGEVLVNDKIVDLTFENKQFRIESMNETISIWSKFGIFLQWYFNGEVLIAVPLDISTSLCGVCGNFQEYHMKKTGFNHSAEKECVFQIVEDQDDWQVSRSHQYDLFWKEKWLHLFILLLIHGILKYFNL